MLLFSSCSNSYGSGTSNRVRPAYSVLGAVEVDETVWLTLLDDFEAFEDAVVVVEADFRGRPRPFFLLLVFFPPFTIGSSSISSATSSFISSSSISLSRRCLFVVVVGLFVLFGGSIFSTFSATFSTDFLLLFSFIDDGFFDVVVVVVIVDAMTVVVDVDCFDCLLLLLLLLPVVFRLRFVTVNEAIVSTFN